MKTRDFAYFNTKTKRLIYKELLTWAYYCHEIMKQIDTSQNVYCQKDMVLVSSGVVNLIHIISFIRTNGTQRHLCIWANVRSLNTKTISGNSYKNTMSLIIGFLASQSRFNKFKLLCILTVDQREFFKWGLQLGYFTFWYTTFSHHCHSATFVHWTALWRLCYSFQSCTYSLNCRPQSIQFHSSKSVCTFDYFYVKFLKEKFNPRKESSISV